MDFFQGVWHAISIVCTSCSFNLPFQTPTNICSKCSFFTNFLTPINLKPKIKVQSYEKQKISLISPPKPPIIFSYLQIHLVQKTSENNWTTQTVYVWPITPSWREIQSEGQGGSKRKSFTVALHCFVETLQAAPDGGRLLVFSMSWKALTSEQLFIDWPTPLRLQSPVQSSLISSLSCWSVKSLHFLHWRSFLSPLFPQPPQPPCSGVSSPAPLFLVYAQPPSATQSKWKLSSFTCSTLSN